MDCWFNEDEGWLGAALVLEQRDDFCPLWPVINTPIRPQSQEPVEELMVIGTHIAISRGTEKSEPARIGHSIYIFTQG